MSAVRSCTYEDAATASSGSKRIGDGSGVDEDEPPDMLSETGFFAFFHATDLGLSSLDRAGEVWFALNSDQNVTSSGKWSERLFVRSSRNGAA